MKKDFDVLKIRGNSPYRIFYFIPIEDEFDETNFIAYEYSEKYMTNDIINVSLYKVGDTTRIALFKKSVCSDVPNRKYCDTQICENEPVIFEKYKLVTTYKLEKL